MLGIEVLLTTSPEWWSTEELTRSIPVATVERLVIKYAEDRFAP